MTRCNMDFNLEKECSALGGLFQSIVNDLKLGYPAWEDFGMKATKLSVQLRTTIASINLFLDALQKVADFATNAKGGTRDIGTALTRICMRHRSIENRLKTLSSALLDCLVQPLQDKMEDWKQRAITLDRDHAKVYKKTRADIKKRNTDTLRLQKKVRKGENRMQPMLDSSMQEVNDRYLVLLDSERKMVRKALVEQRSQYCLFVSWFKPVLDLELSLLDEISNLDEVTGNLYKHSAEPFALPSSSENVIYDIKGLEHTWNQQIHTPPSSPGSSLGSRQSSYCSLSSAGDKSHPLLQKHPGNVHGPFIRQEGHVGYIAPAMSPRFSSMSSQDSGIAASHDVIYAYAQSSVRVKQSNQYDEEHDGSTPGSFEGGSGETGGPDSSGSQQSTPSPSPSAVTWPTQQPQGLGTPMSGHAPSTAGQSTSSSPRHRSSLMVSSRGSSPSRASTTGVIVPTNQVGSSLAPSTRPHTISAYETRGSKIRPPLAGFFDKQNGANLNRPMSLGVKTQNGGSKQPPSAWNPGSGRRSAASTPLQTPTPTYNSTLAAQIPDFNAAQPDQIVLQPIYANAAELQRTNLQRGGSVSSRESLPRDMGCSVTPQQVSTGGRRRPSSFVGDEEDMHRLLEATGLYATAAMGRASAASLPVTARDNNDDNEDVLIDACMEQIDKMSTDLDNYVNISPVPRDIMTPPPPLCSAIPQAEDCFQRRGQGDGHPGDVQSQGDTRKAPPGVKFRAKEPNNNNSKKSGVFKVPPPLPPKKTKLGKKLVRSCADTFPSVVVSSGMETKLVMTSGYSTLPRGTKLRDNYEFENDGHNDSVFERMSSSFDETALTCSGSPDNPRCCSTFTRPATLAIVEEAYEGGTHSGREGCYQVPSGSGSSCSGVGGTLTRRHSMSGKPPPPPARRNSHITAATPTAPAVDFVRSNSRCTTPIEETSYATVMQTLAVQMRSGSAASQPSSPAVERIPQQPLQLHNYPQAASQAQILATHAQQQANSQHQTMYYQQQQQQQNIMQSSHPPPSYSNSPGDMSNGGTPSHGGRPNSGTFNASPGSGNRGHYLSVGGRGGSEPPQHPQQQHYSPHQQKIEQVYYEQQQQVVQSGVAQQRQLGKAETGPPGSPATSPFDILRETLLMQIRNGVTLRSKNPSSHDH